MPSANYLESGSELKIKIDVAYPLNRDAEQIDKTSEDIQDENLPSEVSQSRTKLYHGCSRLLNDFMCDTIKVN